MIGPPPAPPVLAILPAPAGVNHGPGLLSLGDGVLLACWYSGRSEAGPDARILCARSRDGGVRWDPPRAEIGRASCRERVLRLV